MLETRLRLKIKSLKQFDKVIEYIHERGYEHLAHDYRGDRLFVFECTVKHNVWLYLDENNQYLTFANKSPIRNVPEISFKQLKKALERKLNDKILSSSCTCNQFC